MWLPACAYSWVGETAVLTGVESPKSHCRETTWTSSEEVEESKVQLRTPHEDVNRATGAWLTRWTSRVWLVEDLPPFLAVTVSSTA